jgi:hypothetical protein
VKSRILSVIIGLAIGSEIFAQQPEPSTLPQVVKTYLNQVKNSLSTDQQIQAAQQTDELNVFYSFMFCKPCIDYRNGSSPAWLIGYGVGEAKGHSLTPYTVVVIIDNQGNEIIKFPDSNRNELLGDGGYTDAVVVQMAAQKFILGLASPNGRNSPGAVVIKKLGPSPATIFQYESPESSDSPTWDTTLYFKDADNDGVKEMLLDRQSLLNGANNREQLFFRFRSDTFTFEGETIPSTTLANYIQGARSDPNTSRLHQAAKPYASGAFPASSEAPSISDFNPKAASPGSLVTILGTKLSGTDDLIFPGGQRVLFNVTSDTNVVATVPSTTATGKISLRTTYGLATTSLDFAIIPGPAITSFTPTSGYGGASMANPGTRVTITGQRFTGATEVRFAGVSGVNKSVESDTQISVTVPGGAATGKVTVSTLSGTATSATDFTIVPRPTDSIPPTPPPAEDS